LSTHGAEARWIAFIDADEFLFSPTGQPVSEILIDYERFPGVVANWAPFGTSGRFTHSRGLVLENFTTRIDGRYTALRRIGIRRADEVFKSIVDPAAARRFVSAHACEYAHGTAVDENGYPVSSKWIFTKSTSFERIRINHYLARSEADLRAKHAHRAGALYPSGELQRVKAGVRDKTILAYLPRLREALRRRGARVPS
jgi:hypothetical protein